MKRNIDNELWGKTLLSLYRHFGVMANSIDNLVRRIGINSAFRHTIYDSTIVDSNKILELTERKIKIINLKVIVEDILADLNMKDLKILTLCYVDGVEYKKIIKLLNINQRTFFRRKEIAIARFSNKLAEMGYDADKLEKYLHNENWIKNTYYQIVNSTASRLVSDKKTKSQYQLIRSVLDDFGCNINHSLKTIIKLLYFNGIDINDLFI